MAVLITGCSSPDSSVESTDCGAAPPGFSHRTADVGDTTVHYVTGGAGPAVLLLHGFPETWYTWRDVMPRLAATHTVIAVDLPGIGCSSMSTRYDADAMAETLHDALEVPRVAVVGHDTGGWVAFAYARRYRDSVTHLALSGAAIPGFGLENLLDFRSEDSGLPHLVFFARQTELAARLLAGREAEYFHEFVDSEPMRASGVIDEYARWYAEPGRLEAALSQYRAIYRDADANRRGLGPLLEMPTLALSGPPEVGLSADSLARVAKDVREEAIPNAGHYLQEERPDAFADALLSFLG